MIIGVDFDGTIVDHRFPDIGTNVPGAFYWLREWQSAGARLILFTMRSKGSADGDVLRPAVEHCKSHGVVFWGVNENPEQGTWTLSPKPHCNVYVDDAAFGCPLKENTRMGGRPYVDWDVVGPAVLAMLEKDAPK